jgi:predicted phosphate transport protein (TIGR00153 family)
VAFHITPHEDSFFGLFEIQAKNTVDAASRLAKMPEAKKDIRIDLSRQIHDIEHKADTDLRTVVDKVNSSFVTPFDREDILALAAAIDDCVDFMDKGAGYIVLYKIGAMPEKIKEQIEIINKMAVSTTEAMPNLKRLKDLHDYWVEIDTLESKADEVRRSLLVELFDSEYSAKDIMKLRDVLETFESCADAFEHLADLTESIATKES